MVCGASTVSAAQNSATPANNDRAARFRDEQQIGRILLELEKRRGEVAALARENDRLNELVAKLDQDIATLNAQIAEYKAAISAGRDAVAIKTQIEASYKASLADANKTIKRLTSQNKALQKLVVVAALVGAGLGFLLGN